jgi:DNA-binding NarL/FixJ family response regulator
LAEPTSFTVLVVESDRGAVRQIQSCLTIAGLQVLRPAHTVPEALVAFDLTPPDVVVIDLALVADPTLRRAVADASAARSIPLVYLTAAPDRTALARALDGQAAACVVKPLVERQLIATVTHAAMAARAGAALPQARRSELEQKLRDIAAIVNDVEFDAASAPQGGKATGAEHEELTSLLSAREKQIVDLLANGARVVTIARQLQLSPHTVRNHLKSVFRKLNLHGQHELYEYWHRQAG